MTSTVHVEWLDGVNASLTSLQPTSHSHSADVCHKGIEARPQEGAAPGDLLVTSRGDLPARFMCPECLLCFATLSDLKGHWRRHHDTPFPKRTDVSRGAYGLNGLPTCRFCKQDLRSWAYLEKHISEQRCEALWLHEQNGTDGFDTPVQESTGPPPSPSGATQLSPQFLSLSGPVLNSNAFQGLMQEQGWRRLLQVQDLCLHLRQHCIQCNQWVVDGAHLKHHIRCHHKSTWARHHSEATKSCRLLVKCAASPCSWCGRRPGKPARHVTQCAVAWQLSYSAHLLGHGDTVHGRRSSLVWAGPCGLAAASRPTHQHGRARAPTEQATSNGPARPADGARTGQGTDQRRAPTLLSQLTSGRRNSPNGQANASPRGPAGQNPNRHVARLSVEKLPRPGGLGAPIALPNSPRLEATVPAQPGRSQQDHAPDGSSPPDHGVEKESQQHVRAPRGERGSEIQRLDDGSGSLGARQVECRDANPGTSGRHHQGPTRVPCTTQPGPGTPAASRGLDTFSGHPPDHGKHAGPSDNVHVRTCNPQRRGHKAAQALPQLGGPFGLAARRLADPGPAPAAQSVGTVPADRAFQALCSVRLRNYNNTVT